MGTIEDLIMSMKNIMRYAVVLLAFVMAGCASERLETTPPPAFNEFATDTNYRIGVGDDLQVQVWRNPELSTTVPVRPDGKISSPLVGDITAAGLTTQELSKAITEKLTAFVRNPEVTVIVTNPASADFLRRVRVTGAVRAPSSITYRQGMTVLDIVLQAGGPTEFASIGNARLYRTDAATGGTKIYPIDLGAILQKGDLRTNYTLYPADVVTVPERSF
jgi:polysaccharide export outer membrane protein